MNSTRILRQAVQQHRTPLIKFIGKRNPTSTSVVSPTSPPTIPPPLPSPPLHPASPSSSLPDSFVQYRSKAQQHGPLGHRAAQSQSHFPPPASISRGSPRSQNSSSSSGGIATGYIGNHSGRSLGSVTPPRGEYFDRSELPQRFWRMQWTEAEIEAVESGGASVVL